jgi:hypothetical protein
VLVLSLSSAESLVEGFSSAEKPDTEAAVVEAAVYGRMNVER